MKEVVLAGTNPQFVRFVQDSGRPFSAFFRPTKPIDVLGLRDFRLHVTGTWRNLPSELITECMHRAQPK